MTERTLTLPSHLQAGKRAFRELTRAAGGQEEAEKVTGKSQPRISAYGLPNTPDFAAIDVVAALEAVTHGAAGHPPVTRWLAAEAGYLLVRKAEALPADTDWLKGLSGAVGAFNDVQERILDALPDGVTAAELRSANIRGEIAEAMETLAQLDLLAAAALDDGGG